jgi:hypothetical protein
MMQAGSDLQVRQNSECDFNLRSDLNILQSLTSMQNTVSTAARRDQSIEYLLACLLHVRSVAELINNSRVYVMMTFCVWLQESFNRKTVLLSWFETKGHTIEMYM